MERTNFQTNYSVAINWLNGNLILFNNIHDVDEWYFEGEKICSDDYYKGREEVNPAENFMDCICDCEDECECECECYTCSGAEEADREDEDEWEADVYQHFLTSYNREKCIWLCQNFDSLQFRYSDKLGLWVLEVTHYGTSWDYVHAKTILHTAERKLGQRK